MERALLTSIGFTSPEDQEIILAFAKERDLSVAALLRAALRDYQLRRHPLFEQISHAPPYGCPALD